MLIFRQTENVNIATHQDRSHSDKPEGVLLGAVVALWAYRLGGAVAALIAACFFALDPNFLTQAPLVKNDAAMSLGMCALFLLRSRHTGAVSPRVPEECRSARDGIPPARRLARATKLCHHPRMRPCMHTARRPRPARAGRVLASTIALLSLLAALPTNAVPGAVRSPRGIYAVVAIDEEGTLDTSELKALVSNPAVTGGLTIRVFWSTLQPAVDRYDFTRLEEAFTVAAAQHKTVQLIILPGAGAPSWLVSRLPSCDPYLQGDAPSPDASRCGKVTFDFAEGRVRGPLEWPLPWNPEYKKRWREFLGEVQERFGHRKEFVSIAIAGPTVASAEMIVPHKPEQLDRWTHLLKLFYRDPAYQASNNAIVDEWKDAIDSYDRIFHGITLVLTHGSGLLRFSPGSAREAEASIVDYYSSHRTATNLKAIQTSGMRACRPDGEGLVNVKELARSSSLPQRMLGGAQFDTSFSRHPRGEGCPSSCDNEAPDCAGIRPFEALNNVLAVYFSGTPVGDQYGSARGDVPLSYLQIYAKDIQFAGEHPRVQTVLEQASRQLDSIAR
jgi:hypothetical protein